MSLKLAVFGQAPFGAEVTEKLADAGFEIAVVYAPPDAGRPDPLGALAEERGWPLLRYKFFRRKGQAKPEIVEEYRAFDVDLNVLPFTTAILPPEITDAPPSIPTVESKNSATVMIPILTSPARISVLPT